MLDAATDTIQEFSSETLTKERFARQSERTANAYGLGATDVGLSIASRYLEETKDNVELTFEKFFKNKKKGDSNSKTFLGVPLDVFMLDPYVVALAGLQTGVSSVGRCDSLNKTLFALGGTLEDEVYAYLMLNWDAVKAERIRQACRSAGSVSARRTVSKRVARDMGFSLDDWSPDARLSAGRWLLDIILASGAFTLDGDESDPDDPFKNLTLTEEAYANAMSLVDKLLVANPSLLPLKEPPAPWTGPSTLIHGYKVNLVRSFQKPVHATINAAIKSGRMKPVLDSVNAIQGVPWVINRQVLEMVEWCFDNGVQVKGLPSKRDLPVPQFTPEQWAAMDEDQTKVAKKDIGLLKKRNRGFIGERLIFSQDVRTAHWLGQESYWTPVNMDYRGRVYGLTSFQFQRQDYVRAMFLFAEGKPVDADGLYWLKVHVANTGAFEQPDKTKTDKIPFDERVSWVDTHMDDIYAVATDPKENLWWTKADSPFMFMAACVELLNAMDFPGYICRLPVSFDGTCSGLQHLSAMTKDEQTAYYVNLRNTDRPQDIYNVVAELAKKRVETDAQSGSMTEIALKVLDFGVGRSLVKRNVMTYSYSSGKYGMAEQHMEDTMKPLGYKVMSKEIAEHPFLVPEDTFEAKQDKRLVTIAGRTAAKYLASVVYDAIEAVVKRPADAMKFLQKIAKAMSHEGKPVVWHTPLGMPVMLRYPEYTKRRVKLSLHDRGVTIEVQAQVQEETAGIDKNRASNAIAPSFVHSLDACHLQMSVLEASENGIPNVALVHDSFGCLPSDATKFRQLILGQFVKMYGERDVLFDILAEAKEQADDPSRLPELPKYGDLDINEVAEATYAFA